MRDKAFINIILIWLFLSINIVAQQRYEVESPNKELKAKIVINTSISFSLYRNETELLSVAQIHLKLDHDRNPGVNPKVIETTFKKHNEKIFPVVKEKFDVIDDNYNELEIKFARDYSIRFRAYNNGVAYRFVTNYSDSITIFDENVQIDLLNDDSIYFPEEESFITHMERLYDHTSLSEINSSRFCSIPVLIEKQNEIKILITESDIENYAGMYIRGDDEDTTTLKGIFPRYPKKVKVLNDRDTEVIEREDWIAKSIGSRTFPWRIFAVSSDDKELLTNQLVYLLGPENRIEDTDWIKPGKVSWDWWNNLNIRGVDFRAGVNTATYKYYIDFAAEAGLDYIILDEGWYELGNILELNSEIDMDSLRIHAERKNIGMILWVTWKTLDEQLIEVLDQFERWGIAGIKVDFMQRDDQPLIDFYYRVAEEAAKRKMLVDYHGSYKPSGIRRAFPNVITREGVKGLENSKWSEEASPVNNLVIPFTRMVAGPVDYTPGAMRNATRENFKAIFSKPQSLGTRCHQLAMYVVYESPLQMLADSPTHYYENRQSLAFLSKVPVEWDETIPLQAEVGKYVLVARRSGKDWFVGGMTNWDERDLVLDLDFLEEGKYIIEYYRDGINADRNAEDYKFAKTILRNTDEMKIHLAPGGGWAAHIYKIQKN